MSTPDFEKAAKMAISVIKEHKDHKFPFDLEKLIEEIPDLDIIPYSQFSDSFHLATGKVCNLLGSDDAVSFRNNIEKRWLIIYNDAPDICYERKRWSIAHELGHYFLNHKNQGSEKEEKEANIFARHLLTPLFLVQEARQGYSNVDYLLAQKFCVSQFAMQNTLNNLNKLSYIKYNSTLEEIFKRDFA